jgi:nucleotide-binding universal stress UspA family protein
MIEFRALRVPTLTEEVAVKLEILFRDLPGIEQFTITLATQELQVVFDEEQLNFRILVQTLANAGCALQTIPAALFKQLPSERRETMYRKILLPLDGSTLSELALPHAEALAQRFESELLLVRVCPPIAGSIEFYSFTTEAADENQDPPAKAEKDAEAYLTFMQEKLHLKGIKSCYFVLHGQISETILEIAETEQADLIVMSTHGRSGLSRWVYGSVAAKILQAAPCPVFLVRAKL